MRLGGVSRLTLGVGFFNLSGFSSPSTIFGQLHIGPEMTSPKFWLHTLMGSIVNKFSSKIPSLDFKMAAGEASPARDVPGEPSSVEFRGGVLQGGDPQCSTPL